MVVWLIWAGASLAALLLSYLLRVEASAESGFAVQAILWIPGVLIGAATVCVVWAGWLIARGAGVKLANFLLALAAAPGICGVLSAYGCEQAFRLSSEQTKGYFKPVGTGTQTEVVLNPADPAFVVPLPGQWPYVQVTVSNNGRELHELACSLVRLFGHGTGPGGSVRSEPVVGELVSLGPRGGKLEEQGGKAVFAAGPSVPRGLGVVARPGEDQLPQLAEEIVVEPWVKVGRGAETRLNAESQSKLASGWGIVLHFFRWSPDIPAYPKTPKTGLKGVTDPRYYGRVAATYVDVFEALTSPLHKWNQTTPAEAMQERWETRWSKEWSPEEFAEIEELARYMTKYQERVSLPVLVEAHELRPAILENIAWRAAAVAVTVLLILLIVFRPT